MGLQGVYSNIFSLAAQSKLRRGRAFDSPRRDIGLKGKDRTVVIDARGPSPGHSRQQDVEGRVGGRRPSDRDFTTVPRRGTVGAVQRPAASSLETQAALCPIVG